VQEQTIYFSDDGYSFTSPELCLEYERQKARWDAAMQELTPPDGDEGDLDMARWAPASTRIPFSRTPIRDVQLPAVLRGAPNRLRSDAEPRAFLERLAYLQKLAAFMAEE
jgi:hypothetical protein